MTTKISDQTKTIVGLGICVLGVLLLAWWAAAAGPIQRGVSSASAAAGTPATQIQFNPAGTPNAGSGIYMLQPNATGTASTGPTGMGVAGPAESSTPPTTPIYVPTDDTPTMVKCANPYGSGIQPYSAYCPINCGVETNPYQTCCQKGTYLDSPQILCRAIE